MTISFCIWTPSAEGYIESFAKRTSPTKAGKMIYPIATTFIVQWESMLKFYPKAKYWGGIY